MASELEDYNADYTQIEPYLYLGNLETALDRHILVRLNMRRILTIREDKIPDNMKLSTITYMHIPLNDTTNDDIITHFSVAHQFIHDGITKKENVLVHCRVGISRSATLVTSYLMIKHKLSTDRALSAVRQKRPMVNPNDDFYKQMCLFDKMGYGLNPTNSEFRQHLLRRLIRVYYSNLVLKAPEVDQTICSKYFPLLDQQKPNAVTIGKEYKCKNCLKELFNEINVVKDLRQKSVRYQCQTIFIEPQKWFWTAMSTNTNGELKCPKCGVICGSFDWKKHVCKCVAHERLSHLLVVKVNRMFITTD